MATKSSRKHDQGLARLLNELRNEIPNTQVIAKEVQFWRGKDMVAEPDGLIWDGEELYIVEYKSNGHDESKARKQLRNARNFIENDLGIYVPCHELFRYG